MTYCTMCGWIMTILKKNSWFNDDDNLWAFDITLRCVKFHELIKYCVPIGFSFVQWSVT